ncbi:MAG: DUF4382 domain-containing protein [Woeseia sp.]
MKYIKGCLKFAMLPVVLAALAGCGSSSGTDEDATGTLSLAVSDGPVHDALKVCVAFDTVEFKIAGEGEEPSTVVNLDPAETINLLDFQGMNAAPLLIDQELTAGDYEWIRLGVDADLGNNGGMGDTDGVMCDGAGSYIKMSDGGVYNLYIPSGAETGLKLVSGFTVPVNGSADFTVEFDLMKSITAPPGLSPNVILRPALRLVNDVDAGALTGSVASDLATAEACEASVYVFDDGVTPNAIDDGETADPNDPVATAIVNETMAANGQMEYTYTVGYLLAGDYVAAFTCDGTTFEPVDGLGATITANGTTTLDFGF